ncbi:MAG: hypothetical protein NTV01_09795 [Bacteroidia bacterium]|nr:hypothetical protein [Bacteroidia bacterium]
MIFFSIALLFCSCNEDLNLFGTNEEVPVIFAFLNYHDTVNYIRISRTVQPDEGFTRRNSNYYNPDSIWVALEVWNSGTRTGNPVRCYYEPVQKDSGFFQAANSNLYSFRKTLIPGMEYRLFFKDQASGRAASARCISPSLEGLHFDFNDSFTYVNFSSMPDVYYYRITCRFHYVEVTDQDTSFLWLDYPGSLFINPAKDQHRSISMPLVRIPSWDFLPEHIPVKSGVIRYALKYPIEYRISVGDEFLYDYIQKYQEGKAILILLWWHPIFQGGSACLPPTMKSWH